MSYFKCSHGTTYYPFGRGGKDRISGYLKSQDSSFHEAPHFQLPLFMELSNDEDSQVPIVARHPQSEVAAEIRKLSSEMICSLFKQSIAIAQVTLYEVLFQIHYLKPGFRFPQSSLTKPKIL